MKRTIHIKVPFGSKVSINYKRETTTPCNTYSYCVKKNDYLPKNEVDTNHAEKLEIKNIYKLNRGCCKIKLKDGHGSGFFLKLVNKYYLITNEHVITLNKIKNREVIGVETDDGKKCSFALNPSISHCWPAPIDITAIELNGNGSNIVEFLNL